MGERIFITMKSALKMVNPDADAVTNKGQALAINSAAAQGLASVMRSNIGPTGTMKMLVDGAGEITLTKDGSHLLGSMQIQHPTAQLISRAAIAQDDVVGDGTSSTVVFIRELLTSIARSTLQTKVSNELCTHLTDIVVDAVLTIQQEGVPIDNHMVEMQALKHRLGIDTRLV